MAGIKGGDPSSSTSTIVVPARTVVIEAFDLSSSLAGANPLQ